MTSEKPWIEKLSSSQLQFEYGHLTIHSVSKDIQDAKEMFKLLNIDSMPVPSYFANLDCLAFPTIFPFGLGGRSASRKYLQDAAFEKTHVLTANSIMRRDKQYLFFMAQQRERRTIKEGLFCVLNSRENRSLTT